MWCAIHVAENQDSDCQQNKSDAEHFDAEQRVGMNDYMPVVPVSGQQVI